MSDLELIDAVKNGDHAKAKILIENGADVNQRAEQDWTPLNFAAGKGDISMVKLLVEHGAGVFNVGRDQRTPYMIALAAGRGSVARYLKEVEDDFPGEKPLRPPRKYCKAYHLKDLRKYPSWVESRINWKDNKGDGNHDAGDDFPDDKLVFVHQDLTVTESIWHNENVIFNNLDSAWEEFCATSINFKVPDDFDFIVPNEAAAVSG